MPLTWRIELRKLQESKDRKKVTNEFKEQEGDEPEVE